MIRVLRNYAAKKEGDAKLGAHMSEGKCDSLKTIRVADIPWGREPENGKRSKSPYEACGKGNDGINVSRDEPGGHRNQGRVQSMGGRGTLLLMSLKKG